MSDALERYYQIRRENDRLRTRICELEQQVKHEAIKYEFALRYCREEHWPKLGIGQ